MSAVDSLVIGRDQGCCVRCGLHVVHLQRGVRWSVHHRRPRGMGGTDLLWVNGPANLVVLCGSGVTGCHGWVESNRIAARLEGFLISRLGTEVAEDVKILHALHGWAQLTDTGGWCSPDGDDDCDEFAEWRTA